MTNNYIEMGPTDCWPWSGLADEAPNIDAVMACRNPQCCNPRHFVGMPEDMTVEHAGVNPVEDDSLPKEGIPSFTQPGKKRRGRRPKK